MMEVGSKPNMLGECIACGFIGKLKKGFLLRRHVDQHVPTNTNRAQRLCSASGTRNWSALDNETSQAALAEWAMVKADG